MARFTFTIESEEEGEMSNLMVRLFSHGAQPAPVASKAVAAEPVAETEVKEEAPRRTRTAKKIEEVKAEVVPEPEPEATGERDAEVTLDDVKRLGSQAMGKIKASGVAAIFAQHGGGAESFAALDPAHYGAVYDALEAAIA